MRDELTRAAIAVCDRAIQRLKQGGLVKGQFYSHSDPTQPSSSMSYCAVGAIRGAPEEQRRVSPSEDGLALDAEWIVERALTQQIRLQHPQYTNQSEQLANVFEFNDNPDTSVYDVVAVFNTIRDDLQKES